VYGFFVDAPAYKILETFVRFSDHQQFFTASNPNLDKPEPKRLLSKITQIKKIWLFGISWGISKCRGAPLWSPSTGRAQGPPLQMVSTPRIPKEPKIFTNQSAKSFDKLRACTERSRSDRFCVIFCLTSVATATTTTIISATVATTAIVASATAAAAWFWLVIFTRFF